MPGRMQHRVWGKKSVSIPADIPFAKRELAPNPPSEDVDVASNEEGRGTSE